MKEAILKARNDLKNAHVDFHKIINLTNERNVDLLEIQLIAENAAKYTFETFDNLGYALSPEPTEPKDEG